MNKKQLRTPLIKPRSQGGTFYTFGSALEDIGLNINELNNKVALSHYVLLNLPDFDASTFNTHLDYTDMGTFSGDYIFAEAFQNYVLNMETVVRNHPKYDFSNSITVSERIFWKWLKSQMDLEEETGADGSQRYVDRNGIAKCFGYINSGAQRSDDYSMYNETFVQIPSSYGQMKVLYKPVEDDNYYLGNKYESTAVDSANRSNGYLENILESEYEDEKIKRTSISVQGIFDEIETDSTDNQHYIYNVDSSTDLFTVDFSLDSLRNFYGNEFLTYDDIATEERHPDDPESENTWHVLDETFNFNAALIYYSIYDSTNKRILATNAYGLLLFNNAENTIKTLEDEFIEQESEYRFEPMVKKMTTSTMSGTSYSFRLNIKSSSVYSGDILISDNATPAYSMSTDFNDTVKNLNTAINILKSNTNLLASINSNYTILKSLTTQAIESTDETKRELNELKNGNFKKLDSSVLHTDTFKVGDGVSIEEGGKLINAEQGVTLEISNIKSENGNFENIYAKTANIDEYIVSDNGIDFSDSNNEEQLVKIDQKGLSAKNLQISEDKTSGTAINYADLLNIFDFIDIYYNDGEFSIVVNNGGNTITGDILNALYDEETKRLNVKGLLAILIAKIKTM